MDDRAFVSNIGDRELFTIAPKITSFLPLTHTTRSVPQPTTTPLPEQSMLMLETRPCTDFQPPLWTKRELTNSPKTHASSVNRSIQAAFKDLKIKIYNSNLKYDIKQQIQNLKSASNYASNNMVWPYSDNIYFCSPRSHVQGPSTLEPLARALKICYIHQNTHPRQGHIRIIFTFGFRPNWCPPPLLEPFPIPKQLK